MSEMLKDLDRIQRDTKQAQELARQYKAARNAREAHKVGREMAKLSKELEAATSAAREGLGKTAV